MARHRSLVAVALLAFLVVVIARLPLRWALVALPKGIECVGPEGTLWNGRCERVAIPNVGAASVQWTVHASRLLVGRIAADVAAALPSGTVEAQVERSLGGQVELRDVRAQLTLDPVMTARMMRGTTGTVRAGLGRLALSGRSIAAIEGRIEVRQLVQSMMGPPTPLGDFAVEFPQGASGEPAGRLQDLGGPFAVDGTVRLTREPGYVVEGRIAARPGAPENLVRQLQILGMPDAQGRRPFSIAGTY